MYAVRCTGSVSGFRRAGIFFAYDTWTLMESVPRPVRQESMLTVLEVTGPDDPKLSPFPALLNNEEVKPADDSEALMEQIEKLHVENTRLNAQAQVLGDEAGKHDTTLSDLTAENADLKSKLDAANAANADLTKKLAASEKAAALAVKAAAPAPPAESPAATV